MIACNSVPQSVFSKNFTQIAYFIRNYAVGRGFHWTIERLGRSRSRPTGLNWWAISEGFGWPAARRGVPRWLDLRRPGARRALPPATHHFSLDRLVGWVEPRASPTTNSDRWGSPEA